MQYLQSHSFVLDVVAGIIRAAIRTERRMNESPYEFLIIFLIVIIRPCYCYQVISDNSQTISKRNFENIPTTARDMGNGYEALQDHDGGEGDNGKGAGEPGN